MIHVYSSKNTPPHTVFRKVTNWSSLRGAMLERMMDSRIEIHFSCALASLSMTIGRTPSSHSLGGAERGERVREGRRGRVEGEGEREGGEREEGKEGRRKVVEEGKMERERERERESESELERERGKGKTRGKGRGRVSWKGRGVRRGPGRERDGKGRRRGKERTKRGGTKRK